MPFPLSHQAAPAQLDSTQPSVSSALVQLDPSYTTAVCMPCGRAPIVDGAISLNDMFYDDEARIAVGASGATSGSGQIIEGMHASSSAVTSQSQWSNSAPASRFSTTIKWYQSPPPCDYTACIYRVFAGHDVCSTEQVTRQGRERGFQ